MEGFNSGRQERSHSTLAFKRSLASSLVFVPLSPCLCLCPSLCLSRLLWLCLCICIFRSPPPSLSSRPLHLVSILGNTQRPAANVIAFNISDELSAPARAWAQGTRPPLPS